LGTIVAQTIHAAGESSPGGKFLPPDTRAIALAVPDEQALLRLEDDLKNAGIKFRAIREPDAPWNGALMAIGITPVVRDSVRHLLGRLELIR
jgi:hypothetical protein